LKLPPVSVLHSLRDTMLTRLGEAAVEAFTIMRIAGDGAITISQRCVRPTPKAIERAFERLEARGGMQEIAEAVAKVDSDGDLGDGADRLI
jgi:uncharacterized membrane protein YfbV (UPF0208 family)